MDLLAFCLRRVSSNFRIVATGGSWEPQDWPPICFAESPHRDSVASATMNSKWTDRSKIIIYPSDPLSDQSHLCLCPIRMHRPRILDVSF